MNFRNFPYILKTDANKNNKEIFIRAYDEYIDQIYRFVYFKIGSAEEAQDLSSVIFLKVWNYIQNNKINSKALKALIYRIARNSIIDFYRGKGGLQSNSITIDNPENKINIIDYKQDIARSAEVASDIACVKKSLLNLKDEYREVIILRFVEEFSIREIAAMLGKSKGAVRILVFRAIKALREIVECDS